MTSEEKFFSLYKKEPLSVFCPYRVCPLGAHIDHQNGPILGFALDKGVHISFLESNNKKIELLSLNFPSIVEFSLLMIPERAKGDWGDYIRGATKFISEKYELKRGLYGVIKGELPSGGISSSASLTIAFIKALCLVNDIELSDSEYIYTAKRTENEYVGVSSGKLDQSCETLCKNNSILYMDPLDDTYSNIERNCNMPNFKIGIFFSGIERNLVSSAYNSRVDECKAAAFALYSYSISELNNKYNMKEGLRLKDIYLRDISEELFLTYKERLPLSWQKRLKHFYSEYKRVKQGIEKWKEGNIVAFGNLVNESGLSSILNYECGSPSLIKLYNAIIKQDGVYGARFSGAGFKGCCMALIDEEKFDSINEKVEEEYLREFPLMKGKYKAFICSTSDGVGKAEEGRF